MYTTVSDPGLSRGFSILADAISGGGSSRMIQADLAAKQRDLLVSENALKNEELWRQNKRAQDLMDLQRLLATGSLSDPAARGKMAGFLLSQPDGMKLAPAYQAGTATFVDPNFVGKDDLSKILLGGGVVSDYKATPSGFAAEQQRLRDATDATLTTTRDVEAMKDKGLTTRSDAANTTQITIADKGNAAALERTRAAEAAALERARLTEGGLTTRSALDRQAELERQKLANEGSLAGIIAGDKGNTERTRIVDAGNTERTKLTEGGSMDRLKYATERGSPLGGKGYPPRPDEISFSEADKLKTAVLDRLTTMLPNIGMDQIDPGVVEAISTRAAEIFQRTRNAPLAIEQALKEVQTEVYTKDESWLPTGDTERLRLYAPAAGAAPGGAAPAPGGAPTPDAGAIDWSTVDLTPYEGRTLTDPATGAKFVIKGGAMFNATTGERVR